MVSRKQSSSARKATGSAMLATLRKMPTKGKASEAKPSDRAGTAGSNGAEEPAEELSRVIYIGHIPHGFYEDQMKEFFGQFGKVTRVRLSRNKKSARSKGYGFVEFSSKEVAAIAGEAMDGYMMFSQKLSVNVVPQKEIHPQLFKGANKVFKKKPWPAMERDRHNKERTEEEETTRMARAVKRDRLRQKAIAEAGIEFEYDGLASALPVKATRKVFDE